MEFEISSNLLFRVELMGKICYNHTSKRALREPGRTKLMKKRWLLALFTVCLVLCACAKTPQETEPTTLPATEATTVPAETTTPPTESTVPETTEPPVVRHPLNGTRLEEPWFGRTGAVTVNNLRACLPHYGTSGADILYEVETESGITRMLAIFDDFSDVDKLGPIRSTRTFFNCVALTFDAPIFHCGGSVRGRNACQDIYGPRIPDWEHVDQMYNSAYFFRDEYRYSHQGYNWEHTLFTSGERLTRAMEEEGFNEGASNADFGLAFDEAPAWKGRPANKLTVTFRGGKTTTFTYDPSAGLYRAAQYGEDYIDAGNDTHVSFRNVLVLACQQSFEHDGEYLRAYYEMVGSGRGVLAVDGKLTNIFWHRASAQDGFTYTLEDGSPVTLGVGHSYVAISGADQYASLK